MVFDTETTTDETQKLRIGTYQVREAGNLREAGVFYDRDAVTEAELETLTRFAENYRFGPPLKVRTREAFLDEVFFPVYEGRGTVVGFNLPFDLSRLAIGASRARLVRKINKDGSEFVDRSMVDGFTFSLSESDGRPNLRIKSLSRRAAFINFANPGENPTARSRARRGEFLSFHRGFFIDLRTLSAALMSKSYTLARLAEDLNVKRKADQPDFEGSIDATYIEYALNDTDTTWECYKALIQKFRQHGLKYTRPNQIYSEASLGKAYLREMGVRSWRHVQPDFPPELIGAIMSSYFGGRAEIHRRRELVRTIYCDFASMYPTVCTLMGLWKFVIAQGVDHGDATEETRNLLADVTLSDLQSPSFWPNLTTLVQVSPDKDIFPVRTRYGEEPSATIGLNFLSASEAQWFTLADCIASKLQTGKSPQVQKAIRFSPRGPQAGLNSIKISGQDDYSVNPARDDFYRRVIDLRRKVKQRKAASKDPAEKSRLDSEQLALKILANATSYGIFIEINVEEADDEQEPITIYTGQGAQASRSRWREKTGDYFHPLLATSITGAARLMLSLAEMLGRQEGLDWVLCDTDSMAFCPAREMTFQEQIAAVRSIASWFTALNPYEDNQSSIFEIEGENFKPGKGLDQEMEELFCAAISAKRYALFNNRGKGISIRKATAHGLGHLKAPYASNELLESGVSEWQEDVWKAIIKSLRGTNPHHVSYLPDLRRPAVSEYSITTPDRLNWFKALNAGKKYPQQVKPFNFMLSYTPRRPDQILRQGFDPRINPRQRPPKPIAPFSRTPYEHLSQVFDRQNGDHVPEFWLQTYEEALRSYHRHPELKFLNGGEVDFGPTRRRHVQCEYIEQIGKEANAWEEDEEEGIDEDSVIQYEIAEGDRAKMIEIIQSVPPSVIATRAKVSPKRIEDLSEVPDLILRRIYREGLLLKAKMSSRHEAEERWRERVRAAIATGGLTQTAKEFAMDSSNLLKIVQGKRRVPLKLLKP